MSKSSDQKPGNHWPIDAGGTGAIIVISALTYIAAFQPLLRQKAHAQITKTELVSQQHQARELAATHQRFQQKLAALERALPDTAVELRTLNYLNRRLDKLIQLTKDTGLAIEELRPGKTLEDEHYRKILIHLTGTGTFRTCTGFLDRFHASFQDMAVQTFNLEALPEGALPSTTCQLVLVWYTKKEKG